MRLHPNAAVRVLRNELERLSEAQRASETDIARRYAPEKAGVDEYVARIQAANAAERIKTQLEDEAAEISDALAILEAGFEAERGFLAFDTVAA